MTTPTLVLYTPDRSQPRDKAHMLREELLPRGFDVTVQPARPGQDLDVTPYRLVVLVFPVLPVPRRRGLPLGGVLDVIAGLRGLEGKDVAVVAISPVFTRRLTDGVAAPLRHHGAHLVVCDFVPPFGPQGALVDVAAECMVRLPPNQA